MALLPSVEAVPMPKTQEITLHVPSELLKEHTLVLTLSPLPTTGKSLASGTDESSAPGASGSPGEGQAEGETGQREGRAKEAAEEETGQREENEGEEMALTTITPNTTGTNETTSEKPSVGSKTTVAPTVLLPLPGAGDDGKVPELILQFPRHRCPEGHAMDMNGKCRQLFMPPMSRAKSLDNNIAPELYLQAANIQE